MQADLAQQTWISYAITAAIIAIAMALRFRCMGRRRPLKLGSLWIVPALYFLIASVMFVEFPPSYPVVLESIVGILIGAAIGWQRGKMMNIDVDPETHMLNQKASPSAMFFLLGLIVARTFARSLLGQSGAVSPAMLTDPLIAFAVGMLSMTRFEMFVRAKRLLNEACGL